MLDGLPMIRSLRKNWKLNAIAVFSLAVAMALTVVALGISNSILLRPPVSRDSGRLLTVYSIDRAHHATLDLSYPEYRYLRDHSRSFTGIAALQNSVNKIEVTYSGREELVMENRVSDNYFEVMGIQPFMGRFFNPGDDQRRMPSVVLTWACWMRWGADPSIIGKQMNVERQLVTIIGVAPRQFTAPIFGFAADVIVNLGGTAEAAHEMEDPRNRVHLLAARLAPGGRRSQAAAELRGLWDQFVSANPEAGSGARLPAATKDRVLAETPVSLLPPDEFQIGQLVSAVVVAGALLILLIACANTANLLLALATLRRQEALIKTALGAPRSRLIGEFLKETAVLCAAGALVGYALASVVLRALSRFEIAVPAFGTFSIAVDLHPGVTVMACTVLVIALATLASGLAPALYASKPDLAAALSGEIAIGGTRKGILRNAAVGVQVAVCTLVLAGTGLCWRSLQNLRLVDPGFSARKLAIVFVHNSTASPEVMTSQYAQLRAGASRIPSVESVCLSGDLPLGGDSGDLDEIAFTDRPSVRERLTIDSATVDDNYFATFGIRLLEGRVFRESDREGTPEVAVINHFMAEKYWPHQDPIGRTIRLVESKKIATVIGVVADGRYVDLDEPQLPFIYHAMGQHFQRQAMLIARTATDPRGIFEPLVRTARDAGLKTPMPPTTMDNWINLTLFIPLITLACVSGLSVLAGVLAVVGLFGAISYSVSERRRELGIRIALGARPAHLIALIFRETSMTTGTGVAAGLLLAAGATALFRSQFYKVAALEWRVLIPVGLAAVGASLAIAWAATRRWIRMNPMDAVRHT